MHRFILCFVPLVSSACASGPKVPPDQQLAALKQATHGPVESRLENQQNSELLQDVVDSDVLMDLHRHEVASRLGKGDPCTYHPLCQEQGFLDDDWYYDVGVGDEAEVGKRPSLIVGFGNYGTVERVYNLRIH